jgi:synaptojanin
MCKRYYEYASPTNLRVSVGTYNVNGGKHFRSVVYKDVSLADWLLDAQKIARSKCN